MANGDPFSTTQSLAPHRPFPFLAESRCLIFSNFPPPLYVTTPSVGPPPQILPGFRVPGLSGWFYFVNWGFTSDLSKVIYLFFPPVEPLFFNVSLGSFAQVFLCRRPPLKFFPLVPHPPFYFVQSPCPSAPSRPSCSSFPHFPHHSLIAPPPH